MSFPVLTQTPPQQVRPGPQSGGQATPPVEALALELDVDDVDDVVDVVVEVELVPPWPPPPVVSTAPPQATRSGRARAQKKRVRVMRRMIRW